MYDMLKLNDLPGARLLGICKKQLIGESEVGVITDVMKFVIPSVIKNHIPLDQYEKTHHDIFELILDNILNSGSIKDNSTKHLVFDALLTSARNEDHIEMLVKWYKEGVVYNTKGTKLDSVEISLKHKHTIVQRIWASIKLPLTQKQEILTSLEEIDKTTWIDNTKKICESSHPDNKQKLWDQYFTKDKDDEINKWGLSNIRNSFLGFNQVSHRSFIEKLESQFFEQITEIIDTKGRYIAETYFYNLRPMNKTDSEAIKKYEDLLAKTQKERPDNTFFINMLKDTITALNEKKRGVEASEKYLASLKK